VSGLRSGANERYKVRYKEGDVMRHSGGRLELRSSVVLSAIVMSLLWLGVAPPEAPVADAAMRGDRVEMQRLLSSGAEVNLPQGDGMTALHWAAENGDVEMVRMLIDAGANTEAVTRIGDYTPLHVASEGGHGEAVRALLEAGADVDARRAFAGTTALHLAAAAGSVSSIEALVSFGADINARESEWGQTPLIFAASRNRVEAVKTLLANDADASVTTKVLQLSRRAEQDLLAREARRDMMSTLRESSSNPITWVPVPAEVRAAVAASSEFDALDEDDEVIHVDWNAVQLAGERLRFPQLVGYQGGLTALLHAVREGNDASVMALLEAGADIDQPSAGDQTPPLLMAMINGQFDLGMELLQMGADPALASDAGTTPLYAVLNTHWAPKARYAQQQAYQQQEVGYLEAMETLLEAGADPNVRLAKHLWYMEYTFSRLGLDTWGATPFFRAAHALDVEAMKLLVRYGADSWIPTRRPAGEMQYFIDMPAPETESLGDLSGLPPIEAGGPGVYPIHAATGFGGTSVARAGNSQRHVPDGWLPAVKYLVEEHGADVNGTDYLGYTPLHHAAGRGNNEVILYLVEMGADPLAVSRSGQSAADMANGPVSLGAAPFPETIALLESLGTKRNYVCVYC
jgi:ankyrin repeat protein